MSATNPSTTTSYCAGGKDPATPGVKNNASGNANSQAAEKLAQAKGQGQRLASEVKEHTAAYISEKKDAAASSLDDLAQATRRAAETLQERDDRTIARCTEAAAEQTEALSRYLRDRDPARMLSDLEDVVRRHPMAVCGGLFAAGLAVSRFLRSSQREPARG